MAGGKSKTADTKKAEEESNGASNDGAPATEKPAKKEAKKRGIGSKLLTGGAEVVPLLILCYASFIAKNFYANLYPTFPEFDENHNYLKKFGNRIPVGENLRVKVYVKEGKSQPVITQDEVPVWQFKIKYDEDEFEPVNSRFQANVSQKLLESTHNLWLVSKLFTKKGDQIGQAFGKIVKYQNKKPTPTKYWLLSSDVCIEKEEKTYGFGKKSKKPKIARGLPKMQVQLVYDRTFYPAGWMRSDYYPQMYVDEFWLTEDQLIKFNVSGTNSFNVETHFNLMSAPRHRFQMMMEHSLKQNEALWGEGSEELESMRDLFANTHPYLLIATLLVSVLHCIFEYLALKNDVSFWNATDAKTLSQFVSLRSVVLEIFCNVVLWFYLYDQDSNMLVLILSLATIAVDCWKLTRVLEFSCPKRSSGIRLPSVKSRVPKSSTEDYDKIAMRYLAGGLIPVILGYASYSVAYECHKSWGSYVLHSCATMVYALGFALMTPQLFINYRMKSVANLPWRRFVYRAINTFIDDLFSFIIKMPTMHRMSCFRDDIVFVVYLYQRRIYPIDMSRNFDEDAGDAEPEPVEDKKAK